MKNRPFDESKINIRKDVLVALALLFRNNLQKSSGKTLEEQISNAVQIISSKDIESISNEITYFISHPELKFLYHKIKSGILKGGIANIDFKGNITIGKPSPSNLRKSFKAYISDLFLEENTKAADLLVFCEHLKANLDQKLESKRSDEPKQDYGFYDKHLASTIWYLYYHDYLEDTSPYTYVSRLVLQLDARKSHENYITLYDTGEQDEFRGTADINSARSTQTMIINLKRESTPIKELQLRFILPNKVNSNSIFAGQYIDFEKRETLICGTFLLENSEGHFKNLNISFLNEEDIEGRNILIGGKILKVISLPLNHQVNWKKYIPTEIAQYLANKRFNFIKSRTDINNLESLRGFFKDQADKRRLERKFNEIIEYDLFILTPIGSLTDVMRQQMDTDINNIFFKNVQKISETEYVNEDQYEASEIFQSVGINIKRIYYPPRHHKIETKGKDGIKQTSERILRKDLPAMRRSKNVLYIAPIGNCTSALVKAGWAIVMEKPIIVFPLTKDAVPKLLEESIDPIIHYNEIDDINPADISKIPHKLLNYKHLFE